MYTLDARTHRPIAILLITWVAIMINSFFSLSLRHPHSTSSLLNASTLPLHFEPNYGQTDPSVRYKVHSAGGDIYFTPSGVVLALTSASGEKEGGTEIARVSFIGADPSAIEGSRLLPAKVS